MKYRDQKTMIYIIMIVIVIIGMLLGTLLDLEVTKALALDVDSTGNYSLKQNAFYKIFSILGEWSLSIPAAVCLSIIACTFFKSKNSKNSSIVLIISIISLLLTIIFIAYSSVSTLKYFTSTLDTLYYIVAIVMTLVLTFLVFYVVYSYPKKKLITVLPQAFTTILVILGLVVVMFILKTVFGRMRPYALVELGNIESNFVAWYNIHPSFEGAYHSFPSSHVSSITFLLSLCIFIPNYKLNTRTYFIYNTLFSIVIVLMMLSRIGYGAHYLSDVSLGLGIGFIASELNKYFYCKTIDKKMYL